MRIVRLLLAALVLAVTSAACSGSITDPTHEDSTPIIGSGSGT